ncbi:relaxase/mobilization nuclease domain-containing protein [Pseudomonas simiae]|uniref:relaxase/mobilization nuclease domain-containing protein n=1 Tax=Pseudomonas simiae TaxID=321846 RepID=UPI003314E5BC
MNYALKKAALVGGSEVKFERTSIKDYVKLGVKKCDQVNNKYEASTGRTQEVKGLHEMISFDASDKISPEKAAELALGVWREVLDIDNHRHRWAVHTDTKQIHVHLIWNKRDNAGKVFDKKNDYELFEKACHQTELKHGLKEVKNRKYLKPDMPTNPQSSNEWRYEKKGKKSEKTLFKEAVTAATDKAITAGEFLEFLHADGYTLILNGNTGYSLEKDGQIFKASDVGASYKLLKARFGDDPAFSDTLARLGVKTAPVRDFGSIGGDFHDQQSAITERRIKSNRVLDTRFDTDDGHSYRFKGSPRKAFSYSNGTARFNSISPMVIKAGLQKLTESGKTDTLHIRGDDAFKRVVWLQFHMMNLDKKGYSLKGYEPTQLDKAQLEKMKLENPAFKKPSEQNDIKSLPTKKPAEKTKDPEIENIGGAAKAVSSKAVEIAASLLDGAVDKMSDMINSFSAGTIEEKLSEMRALDAEIKTQKNEAEDVHYQNERRRRNQLRPD